MQSLTHFPHTGWCDNEYIDTYGNNRTCTCGPYYNTDWGYVPRTAISMISFCFPLYPSCPNTDNQVSVTDNVWDKFLPAFKTLKSYPVSHRTGNRSVTAHKPLTVLIRRTFMLPTLAGRHSALCSFKELAKSSLLRWRGSRLGLRSVCVVHFCMVHSCSGDEAYVHSGIHRMCWTVIDVWILSSRYAFHRRAC